jgi:phosphotransferase system HPr (HPr) family protein
VKRREVVIGNDLGLHLRSAGAFVRTASKFKALIRVSTPGVNPVDGKSILGLVTLGAAQGSTLVISADGSDEDEALAALVQLVEARFGE